MRGKIKALLFTVLFAVLFFTGCGKKVDGNYTAELDMTGMMGPTFESYGIKPEPLTLNFEMSLSNGSYEAGFETGTNDKMKNWCVKYIKLAIESECNKHHYSTQDYAKHFGYKSIDEYIEAELSEVIGETDLEKKNEGTYLLVGSKLIFDNNANEFLDVENKKLIGTFNASKFGGNGSYSVVFEKVYD